MRLRNGIFTTSLFALGLGVFSSQAHSANLFSGKLWVVDINTALNARFPTPSFAPDITFTTPTTFFDAQGPDVNAANVYVGYTVGEYINNNQKATNVTYSGLVNPVLGYAIKPTQLLNDGVGFAGPSGAGTYGTEIELTGKIHLIPGEYVDFENDDGATVTIDGSIVYQSSGCGGENGGNGTAYSFQWSGAAGYHAVDIVFAESCGGPSRFKMGPLPNEIPRKSPP